MKKVLYICIIIGLLGVMGMTGCTSETVSNSKQENVLPQIYPDYTGVTIPVNIAPLCFSMAEETMVSTNRPMVSTNRQALLIDAVITDHHGPFPPSMTTVGTPIVRSQSTSVLTASTMASATALSHQAMRYGAKWESTNVTSPRLTSVR